MTTDLKTSFPASQRDISLLKQTAMDAASDLSSTASVHAAKAKDQFKDLTGHLQSEGGEQYDQAKGKLTDLVSCARDYAMERPLACIGTALAIGFLIGISRRRALRD